ncbi:AAA family ATPase [Mangrovimonas sp. DI 80]|uniref:AAA family ATPase n=1 Tax=Mangrovimonas sp. DI 80 TaxID=1779330 RepID=UPI00097854A8|nr:AAA family ATPase [Mangrovimonas sp. DI 80]OMP29690.1 LuxR family transcriptional regulator [Mangrovimonas sp. DI 80]
MIDPNVTVDRHFEFLHEIEKEEKVLRDKSSQHGCFIVKSGNEWIEDAKQRPIPNMLFSEFWYEREVSVLFADTNVGKSILGMQIADSISRGVAIDGFQIETSPKKVAYFDFELSDKQFEKRYSKNYTDHYKFHDNFLRAEINPETEIPKEFATFEDYLCHSFETMIQNHGAEVLIIDNITYLKSDNERAKDALALMKHLKALNRKYGASILVLAHTPKRTGFNPITKNDLAGSKMLMNFCDSAFALGESTMLPSYRYIKQIKQRNTEQIYHGENVAVCEIVNPHNFLKLELREFGSETDHLKQLSASDMSERDEVIKKLKSEGLANTKIAEQLGVSEGTIRNTNKRLGL